jgi:hypothetical protein
MKTNTTRKGFLSLILGLFGLLATKPAQGTPEASPEPLLPPPTEAPPETLGDFRPDIATYCGESEMVFPMQEDFVITDRIMFGGQKMIRYIGTNPTMVPAHPFNNVAYFGLDTFEANRDVTKMVWDWSDMWAVDGKIPQEVMERDFRRVLSQHGLPVTSLICTTRIFVVVRNFSRDDLGVMEQWMVIENRTVKEFVEVLSQRWTFHVHRGSSSDKTTSLGCTKTS